VVIRYNPPKSQVWGHQVGRLSASAVVDRCSQFLREQCAIISSQPSELMIGWNDSQNALLSEVTGEIDQTLGQPTTMNERSGASGQVFRQRRWPFSANNLADAQNCLWLMNNQYPSQPLAGGSLYAVKLPATIPAAGQPGGPPPSTEFHSFGGMSDFDPREIFVACIRDPQQLQPTMDRMQAKMQEYQKKRKEQAH